VPSTTRNGYSAGRFVIELEGAVVGLASAVEGGDVVGDVVRQAADPTGLVKKHITNVHWEPLVLTIGVDMGEELAAWVAGFAARTAGAKDGAVIFADYDGTVRSRLEWSHGLITEVRFPGGDATDPSRGTITLTIEPEQVMTRAVGGAAQSGTVPRTPNPWTRNAFRVQVDSIANDTKFAGSVEEVVVRRAVAVDAVGARRGLGPEYGPQDVSDVVITLPEGHAAEFASWLDDFLVKGNHGDAKERNGVLEYLRPSLDVLATLSFKHLGITRMAPERVEAGNGAVARVKVHLYCEEVLFSTPSTTVAAPTPDPTAEALLVATRRALAERDGRLFAAKVDSPGTTEAIAARLVATAEGTGPTTSAEPKDGFALGQRWAAERATLDEFAGLTHLEDPAWTAVTLPEGHSLIAHLRDAGVLPISETGPVDLPRGPVVEGIVHGVEVVGDRIQRAAELGDASSLLLEAMMDGRSQKMFELLSNLMKKSDDTARGITENMK
jgi:hypothetical protein